MLELLNGMDIDDVSDIDVFSYNIKEAFKDESNKCYSSYQDVWIDNVVYIMNQAYEIAKV